MEITSQIKERIINDKELDEFSILNLKNNIDKKMANFINKARTFQQTQEIVEVVGGIVDETINFHINNGDISQKFEKVFRKFISTTITMEIF